MDLVIFPEEILSGKLHFLCSAVTICLRFLHLLCLHSLYGLETMARTTQLVVTKTAFFKELNKSISNITRICENAPAIGDLNIDILDQKMIRKLLI